MCDAAAGPEFSNLAVLNNGAIEVWRDQNHKSEWNQMASSIVADLLVRRKSWVAEFCFGCWEFPFRSSFFLPWCGTEDAARIR